MKRSVAVDRNYIQINIVTVVEGVKGSMFVCSISYLHSSSKRISSLMILSSSGSSSSRIVSKEFDE